MYNFPTHTTHTHTDTPAHLVPTENLPQLAISCYNNNFQIIIYYHRQHLCVREIEEKLRKCNENSIPLYDVQWKFGNIAHTNVPTYTTMTDDKIPSYKIQCRTISNCI